jgi:polyisoprenyl-phosphate glycosyltransferase
MTKESKICVIIPCYNEEKNIHNLIAAIENEISKTKWLAVYVLVNDGSRDETWTVIQDFVARKQNFIGLDLSRNFGKEAALLAGIENAPQCTAYMTMDADLQDDPSIISEMISKVDEGFDVVYGQRLERKDGFLYLMCTKVFYYFMDKATGGLVPKNVADFYIFTSRVRKQFLRMQESVRFTRGLLFYTGFKKAAVQYTREKRVAGSSSWNFFKLAKFSIDGMTSFSTMPLHIISIIGVVGCLLSVIGGTAYLLFSLYHSSAIPSGWPSLISIITFFGSLQILMLGIISEYIARNTVEGKGRPRYIIMEDTSKEESEE